MSHICTTVCNYDSLLATTIMNMNTNEQSKLSDQTKHSYAAKLLSEVAIVKMQ